MFFSLIIGTLNRSDCIKYCLESLRNQRYKNFEINDLTEKTLENFRDLTIMYERVLYKGLSKARNEAVSKPEGDSARYADYTKAKTVLGWEPKTGLAEGLHECYGWIEKQIKGNIKE